MFTIAFTAMELVWVSQKFQLIRERLQLTKAELANILHVSELTVKAIEEGRQELSCEILQALVHRLNISADWLLSGQGDMLLVHPLRINPSLSGAAAPAGTSSFEEKMLDERIRNLEERIKIETQLPLKQIRALFTRVLNLPVECSGAHEAQEEPQVIKLQDLSFADKTLYYKELKYQMKEGQQEFFSHFHKLVSLVCRHSS